VEDNMVIAATYIAAKVREAAEKSQTKKINPDNASILVS
jgi:hypothetical protein